MSSNRSSSTCTWPERLCQTIPPDVEVSGESALIITMKTIMLPMRGVQRCLQQLRLVNTAVQAQFDYSVKSVTLHVKCDTTPTSISKALSRLTLHQRGTRSLERISFNVPISPRFSFEGQDVPPDLIQAAWKAMLDGLGQDAGSGIRFIEINGGVPGQLIPELAAMAAPVCTNAAIRVFGLILNSQTDVDAAGPFLSRLILPADHLQCWTETIRGNQVCTTDAELDHLPAITPRLSRLILHSPQGSAVLIAAAKGPPRPTVRHLEVRDLHRADGNAGISLAVFPNLDTLRVVISAKASSMDMRQDSGAWQLTGLPSTLRRLEVQVGAHEEVLVVRESTGAMPLPGAGAGVFQMGALEEEQDPGDVRRRQLLRQLLNRCWEQERWKLWQRELARRQQAEEERQRQLREEERRWRLLQARLARRLGLRAHELEANG